MRKLCIHNENSPCVHSLKSLLNENRFLMPAMTFPPQFLSKWLSLEIVFPPSNSKDSYLLPQEIIIRRSCSTVRRRSLFLWNIFEKTDKYLFPSVACDLNIFWRSYFQLHVLWSFHWVELPTLCFSSQLAHHSVSWSCLKLFLGAVAIWVTTRIVWRGFKIFSSFIV